MLVTILLGYHPIAVCLRSRTWSLRQPLLDADILSSSDPLREHPILVENSQRTRLLQ
jgi:hypothetical protein